VRHFSHIVGDRSVGSDRFRALYQRDKSASFNCPIEGSVFAIQSKENNKLEMEDAEILLHRGCSAFGIPLRNCR
jgi:hypothetical protein